MADPVDQHAVMHRVSSCNSYARNAFMILHCTIQNIGVHMVLSESVGDFVYEDEGTPCLCGSLVTLSFHALGAMIL